MDQSPAFYAESAVAQVVAPWLAERLPRLDPTVVHRLVQLTTGILEHQSLVIEDIARGSAFRATAESNATQVRRIVRDTRLSLEQVYYPLIRALVAEIPSETLYLSMDASAHTNVVDLFQIALISDATALPLGFIVYDTDAAWAADARALLADVAALLPADKQVILLADRGHASSAFVHAVTAVGWDYIIRVPADTLVETAHSWQPVGQLHPRRYPLRRFPAVAVWKTHQVMSNVVVYRYERAGFQAVRWYLITSLPPSVERCCEYACRWWQECGFTVLKSALFQWERSRVTRWERVEVLLLGAACATWVAWMLGRQHERRPTPKATTTQPQPRRRRVVKDGLRCIADMLKGHRVLCLQPLPPLRVLEYERTFAIG